MQKKQASELRRLTPEAFKQRPKIPLVIVLDNIRSGLNTGSAFRTADAFALQGIYLCGITAQPPHREILKTAIGATESVDWSYFSRTEDAIDALRQKKYAVWAVEQAKNSVLLQDFRPPANQPLALVFGNEVQGVSESVMKLVDGAIEIPQYGTKHSLNVSVCLGIVVWDVFSKRSDSSPL